MGSAGIKQSSAATDFFFGVLKVDEISLPFYPNGGGRGGGGEG